MVQHSTLRHPPHPPFFAAASALPQVDRIRDLQCLCRTSRPCSRRVRFIFPCTFAVILYSHGLGRLVGDLLGFLRRRTCICMHITIKPNRQTVDEAGERDSEVARSHLDGLLGSDVTAKDTFNRCLLSALYRMFLTR